VSDRLAELQRQRALAQEQLAWFDREIAKESARTGTAAPLPAAAEAPIILSVKSMVVPAEPVAPLNAAAAARVADEIIAQYEKNPQNAAKDVKKGCYLWFAFGLGMLVISAVGIYLIYTYLR
jgi:hypothetical protein